MPKNDNRNYHFDNTSESNRREYPIIESLIQANSSVIDLGSGDGSLLKRLVINKQVKACGIEITQSGINSAAKKGLKLKKGRIDTKLPYRNKQFDYAICNVTLQMTMYPEILLKEMQRISRYQITTFPNFAFVLNRLELLLWGRMPRTMIPGYQWYSTGHIHQLSIRDYEIFCQKQGIKIIKNKHMYPEALPGIVIQLLKYFPNLFASTAVYITK